jgi:predicted ATPase
VLETRFPETVETEPELLAHHYTEAGLSEQAIPYWHQAGQQAVERSANAEAIAHLTRGLEVLNALPDSPERTHRELDLQIALGAPLMATRGYAAPEVGQTYAPGSGAVSAGGRTVSTLWSTVWTVDVL